MSPAALPRSCQPTEANSNHAPLSIHVRLAYGHNDGYNVTRNSDFPRRRIRCYGMVEHFGRYAYEAIDNIGNAKSVTQENHLMGVEVGFRF